MSPRESWHFLAYVTFRWLAKNLSIVLIHTSTPTHICRKSSHKQQPQRLSIIANRANKSWQQSMVIHTFHIQDHQWDENGQKKIPCKELLITYHIITYQYIIVKQHLRHAISQYDWKIVYLEIHIAQTRDIHSKINSVGTITTRHWIISMSSFQWCTKNV